MEYCAVATKSEVDICVDKKLATTDYLVKKI